MISVLPIFLRVKWRDLETASYWYMRKYKDPEDSEYQRARRFVQELCEVAAAHERCLGSRLLLPKYEFDRVLTIPSKNGRVGAHPLSEIVSSSAFGKRFEVGLTYLGPVQETRVKQSIPTSDWGIDDAIVNGKSILLVDDLWTQGWTTLSAATALVEAGAKCVGVIALGRHQNDWSREFSPKEFKEMTKNLGWMSDVCAFCDERVGSIANPSLPVQ